MAAPRWRAEAAKEAVLAEVAVEVVAAAVLAVAAEVAAEEEMAAEAEAGAKACQAGWCAASRAHRSARHVVCGARMA